jgi:hypothetical protein
MASTLTEWPKSESLNNFKRKRKIKIMRHKTKDSSLAFYVNQLENLDKTLYEPLVEVSWGRDIALRPGVSLSDETTSFVQSQFAGSGTLKQGSGNIPWVNPGTTAIPGVGIDGTKVTTPLLPAAREISFTEIQLQRSQKLGQSIDQQQTDALNLLYQMNTDQMVYIGDTSINATGLLNNASVTTTTAAATGSGSSTTWASKTAAQILVDINSILTATWTAAGVALCPRKLGIPPVQFGLLAATLVSSAGNMSILEYVKINCIANAINGTPLDIVPMKWLTGRGASGADRIIAYTNDVKRVRFPMAPIQRLTAYYQGIRFAAPYIWAYGQIEFVYPETVQYMDGV